MYSNRNKSITIEYDPDIISKLKELIKEGFDKLKSFVKREKSDFKVYYELDEKFNEIALKLENYEFLNEELDYFLSISDKILYIIYQNCKDSSFGHYDFALELFDLFIEIWNTKIRLINNFSKKELKKYETFKNNFRSRYGDYRHEFYLKIYESENEFSQKEMYEIHKSLRGG